MDTRTSASAHGQGDAGLDTFPRWLMHHAKVRPQHPAMREKEYGIWQTYTWAQVAENVRAIACGLAQLGFKRGDRLAVVGDNRPRLYWSVAACQCLGGIPVMMYQDAVAQEMVYVLQDAEIKFAIVEDQEQVDKMLEIQPDAPMLEHVIYDDARGMRHYTQPFLHDVHELMADLDVIEQRIAAKNTVKQTAFAASQRSTKELIRARGLSKSLGGKLLFDGLDLIASPGDRIGLVGANGVGKTTTIGKLGVREVREGRTVLMAAGDTFRAAAIGQLGVWAERLGVPIVKGPEGGDPSAVVFDAVKEATAKGIDALIVDTAGRLQNKRELMDELAKIRKVLGRLNPEAPHDVVLVLDATNGQNALAQIDVFKEVAGVTGLIMTKLDGTARGGVLVAAAEQYGLPIHAIGVGEKIEDLRPFDPDLVARVIAGVA